MKISDKNIWVVVGVTCPTTLGTSEGRKLIPEDPNKSYRKSNSIPRDPKNLRRSNPIPEDSGSFEGSNVIPRVTDRGHQGIIYNPELIYKVKCIKIIAIIYATFAKAKRKPEKKFRLVRDLNP